LFDFSLQVFIKEEQLQDLHISLVIGDGKEDVALSLETLVEIPREEVKAEMLIKA